MPIKHSRFTFKVGESKLFRPQTITIDQLHMLGYNNNYFQDSVIDFGIDFNQRYGKKYPLESNPYCWFVPVDVVMKNRSDI